ncbi:hypothetical protein CF386_00425 [Paraphotobacterium marinum]|uniref:DNA polymerase III subunit delta' n=1 Tax=Paraphotobacterium marinum TaxID=1755811 RepID=A0A220VBK6_9GAMM|nr:DNA polymerase III subunit delta' C-terminal domain-containing protein [Paraphotobacterium marinum]ASK77660.1 hypothetical protein CF386_00425 [Paraphotobacterium marinum]
MYPWNKPLYQKLSILNKEGKLPNSLIIQSSEDYFISEVYVEICTEILRNKMVTHEDSNFTSRKKLIKENKHPDCKIIFDDTEIIRIEEIRDILEWSRLSSIKGDNKIIVIENCSNLNEYSSNALLKLIEEPPLNLFIILITPYFEKVKSTILSRCIKFWIKKPTIEELKELFHEFKPQSYLELCSYLTNFSPKKISHFLKIERQQNLNKIIEDFIFYIKFSKQGLMKCINSFQLESDIIVDIMNLFLLDLLKSKLNSNRIIFKEFLTDIVSISNYISIETIYSQINGLRLIKKDLQLHSNLNFKLIFSNWLIQFSED